MLNLGRRHGPSSVFPSRVALSSGKSAGLVAPLLERWRHPSLLFLGAGGRRGRHHVVEGEEHRGEEERLGDEHLPPGPTRELDERLRIGLQVQPPRRDSSSMRWLIPTLSFRRTDDG
jgi:hypothetical protein